jgi:deoxyadenosine/deoxycytidine kinase
MPWRHIAIEGPIGAGKSTLTRLLARELDAVVLLERPQDNPFLHRFYADGSRFAFQTQLFFLFQRIEQYRALSQPGMFTPTIVSDFMFAKDALFARLTLSDDEFALYRLIQAQAVPAIPAPDVVVWLQAPVALLQARIRQRGIAMEQSLEAAYIERIAAAYAEYFDNHRGLPLLAVDVEQFNPVDRPADLERLVSRLQRFVGPREVF